MSNQPTATVETPSQLRVGRGVGARLGVVMLEVSLNLPDIEGVYVSLSIDQARHVVDAINKQIALVERDLEVGGDCERPN